MKKTKPAPKPQPGAKKRLTALQRSKAPLILPIHCGHEIVVDASAIAGHPRNINKHPKEQVERLADILFGPKDPKTGKREGGIGWREPVTVSRYSGYSMRGHGRVEAALLAGQPVPIEFQDYASEAEELADLIATKRAAEGSSWDAELTELALADIDRAGIKVELTGFDDVSLAELRAGPKLKGTRKKSTPGGTPKIAYEIQFGTDEQQQTWFLFLRKLNISYPEAETIGERLALWIKEKGEVEL